MAKETGIRSKLIRFIYEHDGVSRNEIASQLLLSMPTVLQNIRTLSDMNLIREDGKYDSVGGRKAGVLRGIPMARIAMGCEINNNGLIMSILDLFGNELCTDFALLPLDNSLAYCREIQKNIYAFAHDNQVNMQDLLGLCFAVPAPINLLENYAEFYLGSEQVTMSLSLLREQFDIPVSFLRSSDAGAIAELRSYSSNENLLYLSLNQKLSATFFCKGTLYKGDFGRSNRIGHMTLIPNGKDCYCGKKGCSVAYCSSNCLSVSSSDNADNDIDAFFTLLKNGDPAAETCWNDYLKTLALLANNMHYIYDCPIIIGGTVGCRIRDRINQLRVCVLELDPNCHGACYIVPCHYGRRINSIGAAYSIVSDYFDHF